MSEDVINELQNKKSRAILLGFLNVGYPATLCDFKSLVIPFVPKTLCETVYILLQFPLLLLCKFQQR